jgi:hypothetical protein
MIEASSYTTNRNEHDASHIKMVPIRKGKYVAFSYSHVERRKRRYFSTKGKTNEQNYVFRTLNAGDTDDGLRGFVTFSTLSSTRNPNTTIEI